MKLTCFVILIAINLTSVKSFIRKFRQQDFDKWIDENNFLVVLFCQSVTDKSCQRETVKLTQLASQLTDQRDIIVGYLDKETDLILFSRYGVQSTPLLKLFPYGGQPIDHPNTIKVSDTKKSIISTRQQHFDSIKTSTKKATSIGKPKASVIPDIDWLDFPTTVKNPDYHALLIVYDEGCGQPCKTIERAANIFKDDEEIKFYKISLENMGVLRESLLFTKNPSVFWYPKSEKNIGFIFPAEIQLGCILKEMIVDIHRNQYGGDLTLDVFVEFINDHAGVSRDNDGNLKKTAGRILDIDSIIKENILNILMKKDLNYVIYLVEKKSKELPHAVKFINYYLAILQEIKKSKSEADKILEREQKFIVGRLSQKKATGKEVEDWQKYHNIISSFVEFAAQRLSENKAEYYALTEDPYMAGGMTQHSHHDEL